MAGFCNADDGKKQYPPWRPSHPKIVCQPKLYYMWLILWDHSHQSGKWKYKMYVPAGHKNHLNGMQFTEINTIHTYKPSTTTPIPKTQRVQ